MDIKVAYTIKEVSQIMGVAEQTVRRLIHNNDMPSIRVSARRIIIPISSFNSWLMERSKPTQAGDVME